MKNWSGYQLWNSGKHLLTALIIITYQPEHAHTNYEIWIIYNSNFFNRLLKVKYNGEVIVIKLCITEKRAFHSCVCFLRELLSIQMYTISKHVPKWTKKNIPHRGLPNIMFVYTQSIISSLSNHHTNKNKFWSKCYKKWLSFTRHVNT